MNDKLVIENREFYFHPTHKAYAGSIDGCVVHVVAREPTFGSIYERGYYEITVEDYWDRILVHNFIWECHHGLLKNGEKIKHINKIRYDNRLMNLKLRSSNEIIVKISTNKKISYV